jgi:hypothetical protein
MPPKRSPTKRTKSSELKTRSLQHGAETRSISNNSVDNSSNASSRVLPSSEDSSQSLILTSNKDKRRFSGSSSDSEPEYRIKRSKHKDDQRVFFKEIPKFSGEGAHIDYELWWSQLKIYFSQFDISEPRQVLIAQNAISGVARKIVDSHPQLNTLSRLDEILRTVFVSTMDKVTKLKQSKQNTDESIMAYAAKIRMNVVESGVKEAAVEGFCLNYFLHGLKPEIGKKVQPFKPESLRRAIELPRKDNSLSVMDTLKTVADPPNNDKHGHLINKLNSLVQSLQSQLNASNAARELPKQDLCPSTTSNTVPTKNKFSSVRCFHCDRLGHGYMKCFKASADDNLRITSREKQKYDSRSNSKRS